MHLCISWRDVLCLHVHACVVDVFATSLAILQYYRKVCFIKWRYNNISLFLLVDDQAWGK